MSDKLDAYGHMNWTVGNEDWMACFDAIRVGDDIEYHIIVNCESGGFIDTVEHKVIPVSQIDRLYTLPEYWADICGEHYADSKKRCYRVKVREVSRTKKAWAAHLDELKGLDPILEVIGEK